MTLKKYKLIPGVNVDTDTGEVFEGYYLERDMPDADKPSSFFIQGSKRTVMDHIRKTNGIIDMARLEKLSKFLIEEGSTD